MKYFIDTEFIEDGKTIDLISIGIVSEDGKDLYMQNRECDHSKANEWVKENVLPHLCSSYYTRDQIRQAIQDFIYPDPAPEFWAYYADYDWVVFCQLWGSMMDLPKHFPMFCRDIRQLEEDRPAVSKPEEPIDAHNALADAYWNKRYYDRIMSGV